MKLRARLLFNVSDLWPESARQLDVINSKLVLSLAEKLELFLYRHSEFITGQTQYIVADIQNRTGHKHVFWLPNAIDTTLYQHYLEKSDEASARTERRDWRLGHGFGDDDFIILYAGILGHPQNLEIILEAARRLRDVTRIRFVLIGTGPRRQALLQLKERLGVDNVTLLDPVQKSEMPTVLNAVDAGVVPLLDREIFRGAIPSKIFELLIMRKPLLLGVEGEARRLFIEEKQCGLAFKPEDDDDLATQAAALANDPASCAMFGDSGHEVVMQRFTLDITANNLWKIISASISGKGNKSKRL